MVLFVFYCILDLPTTPKVKAYNNKCTQGPPDLPVLTAPLAGAASTPGLLLGIEQGEKTGLFMIQQSSLS